jgi:hypothetical protein
MSKDTEFSYPDSSPSIQLPFAILTCALAVVMITQVIGITRQKTSLQEGKIQLNENSDKFAKALIDRKPMVEKSGELKAKLNAMIQDIIILGKTDDDAKAIIQKYNIQQNLPPPSESAAPAQPAPAPIP